MAQLVLNLVVSDQMGCSFLNSIVEFGDGLCDLNCLSHPSKLSSQVGRNKSLLILCTYLSFWYGFYQCVLIKILTPIF